MWNAGLPGPEVSDPFFPLRPPLLVLCGATATGKSTLALALAEALGGEIVSADSMQVYRGMDVGTAKPSFQERAGIPHHGLDLRDPEEGYSAAEFQGDADGWIEGIHARGRIPIVVGGTGLYLRALLDGLMDAPSRNETLRASLRAEEEEKGPGTLHRRLQEVDPETALRLHPRDLIRIERALEVWTLSGQPISALHQAHRFAEKRYPSMRLRLDLPKAALHRRIDARAEAMWKNGWCEEVRNLMARGLSPHSRPLQALGYQRVVEHLLEGAKEEDAVRKIQSDTRTYARRQENWFRGDREALSQPPFPEGFPIALERARGFLQDAGVLSHM